MNDTWLGLFGASPDGLPGLADHPGIGKGDRVLIRGLDGGEVIVVVDDVRPTRTGVVLDVSTANDESPRPQPEG